METDLLAHTRNDRFALVENGVEVAFVNVTVPALTGSVCWRTRPTCMPWRPDAWAPGSSIGLRASN